MEINERILNFLKDYEELCKKYDISFAHEDYHGAFILEEYSENNVEWAKYALNKVSESSERRKEKEENQKIYDVITEELKQCLDNNENLTFKSIDEVWGVYDNNNNFIREATDHEKDLIFQMRKIMRAIKYN